MTLTLQLPPEVEQKLLERAAEAGQSVEAVAAKLLGEALGLNGAMTAGGAARTFDQILDPVRKGWQESGLSDGQVDELFDEALARVRGERREGAAR